MSTSVSRYSLRETFGMIQQHRKLRSSGKTGEDLIKEVHQKLQENLAEKADTLAAELLGRVKSHDTLNEQIDEAEAFDWTAAHTMQLSHFEEMATKLESSKSSLQRTFLYHHEQHQKELAALAQVKKELAEVRALPRKAAGSSPHTPQLVELGKRIANYIAKR